MRRLLAAFGLAFVAASAHADTVIENRVGPDKIRITLCTNTAFSICSLTFRGQQYVDNLDHGRQFQSASSFDGLGESFNPTESGSLADGYTTSPSSTKLEAWWTASEASASICGDKPCKNQAATQKMMAYWLPVQGTTRSNHRLHNNTVIGWGGMPNVIQHLTSFVLPASETHASATIETLTGYMPAQFNQFFTLDVKGGATQPVPISYGAPMPGVPGGYGGEQGLPLIFSTVDGQHAIGVFSPHSPQASWPTAGYGRFIFTQHGGITKWNNVFRYNSPAPGSVLSHRTFFVVGTFNEVVSRMASFHGMTF